MRNGEVGVIEGSAEPICGGVAGITGSWISGGEVVGDETTESLRAVPGGLMTTETGCIRRGQRIVIVHVAIGAGLHPTGSGHHMSACQWPASSAVIKPAVGPSGRIVASGAQSSGELRGNVIGNSAAESLRAVPVGGVAPIAVRVGGGEMVVAVDVTEDAGSGRVGAGEDITRDGVVEGSYVRP